MASGAEAAKNLFDSAFNKTKEVLTTAAESTKGLANVAIENVQKIIPGQGNSANAAAAADPRFGMSSNLSGRKRKANGSQSATLDQLSQIDFTQTNSPLLLVAAMLQNQRQFAQQLQQLQNRDDPKDEGTQLESHSDNSTSPSSLWPRSSSPAQLPLHKIRKLKLYSVDEKIDIIDYAKVIGNRAAGREFNVAESSIREWRKNEDRLRKQSESSLNGVQRLEAQYADLIHELDNQLVEFVDATVDTDWYAIRDKARDLWPIVTKGSELENTEHEMQITMGWVTRFMKRNEDRVRRIAPPVIATANASNTNNNGSVSMVRKASPFAVSDGHPDKTPISSSHATSSNPSPTSSTSPSPATLPNSTSRRKCAQPRRAADATLLLTPDKERPNEDSKDPNCVEVF